MWIGPFALLRPAQGLAINRNHLGRRTRQGSNPGCKAALEVLGIEAGEDIAQMVMRGRAVQKRPEPSQKAELLGPKAGDINKRLGPSQHRKKRQKQHLIQPIHNLAALARVRQIFKITKKYNRLATRPTRRQKSFQVIPP